MDISKLIPVNIPIDSMQTIMELLKLGCIVKIPNNAYVRDLDGAIHLIDDLYPIDNDKYPEYFPKDYKLTDYRVYRRSNYET